MPRYKKKKHILSYNRGLPSRNFNISSKEAIMSMLRSDRDSTLCPLNAPQPSNKNRPSRMIWVTDLLLNKSFRVDFDPADSVRKVKTYIERATGIPWRKQVLLLSGMYVLEDTDMMSEIEVNEAKWRISVAASNSFQYVKIRDKSDNTHFVMEIDYNAKVSSLYDKIVDNTFEKELRKYGKSRRMLFLGHRVLEEHMPIKHYKISKGDELTMIRFQDTFPRKIFVETGVKNAPGVVVGPFLCEPETTVYQLKCWFLDMTQAPKGQYKVFIGPEEVPSYIRMGEIDVINSQTFRIVMCNDPLTNMKPRNYKKPKKATATSTTTGGQPPLPVNATAAPSGGAEDTENA